MRDSGREKPPDYPLKPHGYCIARTGEGYVIAFAFVRDPPYALRPLSCSERGPSAGGGIRV